MAKKKLFGNRIDPSCETCALGMVSSDGETVLCRHAGAPLKHHFCKKFRYDPLKRTPHREPTLESFNASDFSLMDPEDEIMEPVRHDEPEEDPIHDAILDTLRTYLDSTDAPNADDILELLSMSNEPSEDAEDISEDATENDEETTAEDTIEEEASETSVEDEEPTEESEPTENIANDVSTVETEEPIEEDFEEPVITDDDAIDFDDPNEYRHSSFLASEEDIRRDMEQFTVEVHRGASARAAFNNFAVELPSKDVDATEPDEAEPVIDTTDDTAIFADVESDFELSSDPDDHLLSDDLLFLDLDQLDGETIESLVLNEDGSLSTTTEEL